MSCLLLNPEDPPPGDGSQTRNRRAVAAGAGGVGLGVAAVSTLWSAPLWVGIALCLMAIALLVMATLILFGRRDDPTDRLIRIIKAWR
jgi:hypothetical protein